VLLTFPPGALGHLLLTPAPILTPRALPQGEPGRLQSYDYRRETSRRRNPIRHRRHAPDGRPPGSRGHARAGHASALDYDVRVTSEVGPPPKH